MVQTTMGTNPSGSEEFWELGISGFKFTDLFEPDRLADLSIRFDDFVQDQDRALFDGFAAYRASAGDALQAEQVSDLLVRMAPFVGQFVARLFGVEPLRDQQRYSVKDEVETIFTFKREVVMKVGKKFRKANVADWDIDALGCGVELLLRRAFPDVADSSDLEYKIASAATRLLQLTTHYQLLEQGKDSEFSNAAELVDTIRKSLTEDVEACVVFADALAFDNLSEFSDAIFDWIQRWVHAAAGDTALSRLVIDWVSYKKPERTDFGHLVEFDVHERNGFSTLMGPLQSRRRRDGFALTDKRYDQREVLYEVDHCIYCHERDTDSCSKGMRNKKDAGFKVNPLGVNITGCPLDEKISEMHLLKRQGDNIGALALIVIDNPMCPGTGHRICNDCMKGCIYQKTQPVDIPQIETSALTDVLFMPYGFEMYSLLTRWNPLNIKRPHALPYNGKNVLVTGLGPSGYTLVALFDQRRFWGGRHRCAEN